MARLQTRKRQRAEDLPQDHSPPKRARFGGASTFPSQFFDSLSRVWLTRRALEELDQRVGSHLPTRITTVDPAHKDLAKIVRDGGRKLARFARSGGPDLRDLRGYQSLDSITRPMASASASSASSSSSRRTRSTKATTPSTRSRRSSAYDANFEQHLIDNKIYPPLYELPDNRKNPKPANLTDIRQALKAPRRSLSPSLVSESAFEDFQRKNKTKSEGTIMRSVVPLLAGDADIPNEGHLPFINLDSLTNQVTVNPVPDFFDGAHPASLDQQVREDLGSIIIPTRKAEVPVAPNFFLEAKGPGGTAEVAQGQTVLNGAHGAAMMHALQNYLVEEPIYDGNAYAFSSTMVDGQLKLFAHHLTISACPKREQETHTTQLNAFALTGEFQVWREGREAFRNLRRLAKDYRDHFIEAANIRARSLNTEDAEAQAATLEAQDQDSSPATYFDCESYGDGYDGEDTLSCGPDLGLAIFDHGCIEDDHRQGPESPFDTEASTGFAASSMSSFTDLRSERPEHGTKLPRTPPSPSASRRRKKRGRGS